MTNLEMQMKLTKIRNMLNRFIIDDKILKFESEKDLLDYVNYNCPEIEKKCENIGDVVEEFEQYFFTFEDNFYLVQYDEALDVAFDIAHLDCEYTEYEKYLKKINYGNDDTYNEFYAYMVGIYDTSIDEFVAITNQMSQFVWGKDFYIKTSKKESLIKSLKESWDCANDEEKEMLVESINELTNGDFENSFDSIISKPFKYSQFRYLEIFVFGVDIPNYEAIERIFELAKDYNLIVDLVNEVLFKIDCEKIKKNEFAIISYLGSIKDKKHTNDLMLKKAFNLILKQCKNNNIIIEK